MLKYILVVSLLVDLDSCLDHYFGVFAAPSTLIRSFGQRGFIYLTALFVSEFVDTSG
ncbi:hypothetical protein OXYTRIMIC_151 [Oxytricha trifallax]|uniref:Uncharacterized protein n=1 Tax=Oxytricha trifallax TaxID=1172189 RepID=A0A073HZ88_9SPIT|nr:hypothetical protein OXYTRIMIC_151 [Oxytricha trifallax]